MWRATGIQPQPNTPRRLLDIACGCAIKSLALAQHDPALRITGVDTSRVLPVARALAQRMGLTGQTLFVTADLLTADFGAGCYDIALLGQITDYLTPAQNRDLFRRVYGALRVGGALVLDVPMAGEQPAEWTAMVSLLLWVNGGGGTHGFEAYRVWLEQAGFGQIRQSSERWVVAVRSEWT
jgi:ubiquinone/menaquinone biosynthesis C-methylase UbiE